MGGFKAWSGGSKMRTLLVAIVGAVLVGGSASAGQMTIPGSSGQQQDMGMSGRKGGRDLVDIFHAQEMAKMRNEDRQKRLVTDTDKLLAVATDLKAQVEQSSPETLSVDTMKKIDEIERLAHSVKERMKGQ
jgi:hypothetical protein